MSYETVELLKSCIPNYKLAFAYFNAVHFNAGHLLCGAPISASAVFPQVTLLPLCFLPTVTTFS